MENKPEYVLTLSVEQADSVMKACELFARLHIAQFDRITEVFLKGDEHGFEIRRKTANELLGLTAKFLLGTSPEGLCCIHRTEESERAWNVYQALRHASEEYRHPSPEGVIPRTTPHSMIDELIPSCEVRQGGE